MWEFTSHNNTLNEGWCETVVWDLLHIRIHSCNGCMIVVMLCCHVRGVRVWCETLHDNNTLNEGWCETVHYIRIHSMKGGVRLWCETWHHITIHSMKGGVRLWCETCHHITIYWMKGGVRHYITKQCTQWRVVWDFTLHKNTLYEGWCETVVWDLLHITIHSCNGCMIVVMLCCHVRRYMRVSHVMLQKAL